MAKWTWEVLGGAVALFIVGASSVFLYNLAHQESFLSDATRLPSQEISEPTQEFDQATLDRKSKSELISIILDRQGMIQELNRQLEDLGGETAFETLVRHRLNQVVASCEFRSTTSLNAEAAMRTKLEIETSMARIGRYIRRHHTEDAFEGVKSAFNAVIDQYVGTEARRSIGSNSHALSLQGLIIK